MLNKLVYTPCNIPFALFLHFDYCCLAPWNNMPSIHGLSFINILSACTNKKQTNKQRSSLWTKYCRLIHFKTNFLVTLYYPCCTFFAFELLLFGVILTYFAVISPACYMQNFSPFLRTAILFVDAVINCGQMSWMMILTT